MRLYNRLAIRVARGVPADQQDSITPAEMFLDEQCYALAAMLYVMDANFAALVDVWARLPAEQWTVQQQRFAVVYDLAHDNLSVAPDMLATPGVSPGSATRLDGALRDHAAGLVSQMTLARRASLAEEARAAAQGMRPEGQAGLAALLAALTDPSCEGLCKAE